MNVAFTGASGTGKSTLAQGLMTEPPLTFNPVGARSTALIMGFPSPYDTDTASDVHYRKALENGVSPQEAAAFARTMWAENSPNVEASVRARFQARVRADKVAWERVNKDKGFVSDRTTLDDLVYTHLHAPGSVTGVNLEEAVNHCSIYDVIFYCPLEAGQWLGDDALRKSEKTYHHVYDALLRGLLARHRIPHVVLEHQDLEVRRRDVRYVVERRALEGKFDLAAFRLPR